MSDKRNKGSAKIVAVIAVLVILAAIVLGLKFCRKGKEDAAREEATESASAGPQTDEASKQAPIAIKSESVIDYNALKTDKDLQARMDKRKNELGLDQGVDMIVKADEALKIGDTTVPMREILDKIRLEKGDIVEDALVQSAGAGGAKRGLKHLDDQLAKAQKRLAELEKMDLNDSAKTVPEDPSKTGRKNSQTVALKDSAKTVPKDPSKTGRKNSQTVALKETTSDKDVDGPRNDKKQLKREYEQLKATVETYKVYKQAETEIKDLKQKIDSGGSGGKPELKDKLADLQNRRDTLLEELKKQLLPGENIEAYGIYVVKPSDNVWNIHFKFLTEYFGNKGLVLNRESDEPDNRGFSTGVGKILKFSEKMVYIYNLRERKLDIDLDLIHPMSKIVVFNMGQVLSMLNQIDYKDVDQIRFDGENLWLPSKQ